MGLDLWFKPDVARILASIWETMQATSAATQPGAGNSDGSIVSGDARVAAAYRRGFEDALRAVGVAFGLAEGSNGRRAGGLNSGISTAPPEYPRTWD